MAENPISHLRQVARQASPYHWLQYEKLKSDKDRYASKEDIEEALKEANLGMTFEPILHSMSLEKFELAANWFDFLDRPLEFDARHPNILDLPLRIRQELLRQKIILIIEQQGTNYKKAIQYIFEELGKNKLKDAISALEQIPMTIRQKEFIDSGKDITTFDLPTSRTPELTRLHRALSALLILLETPNPSKNFEKHIQKFVIGVLNPLKTIRFYNITDVFGSESNVPNPENDPTRIRVDKHRKKIEKKYGIRLDVFDQGTSIKCPEQCGFYALVSLNQARRVDLLQKITSRFFVLNNASRAKGIDGIDSSEKSGASGLLHFTFELGDGVRHYGVTYGHQTLTHLKPYITELWEIEGTESGTQFRSLEYEQHIGAVSAMTGGALPACYKTKQLDPKTIIPDLHLKKNEVQFLGLDKYGNGICSKPARDLMSRFIPKNKDHVPVLVTMFDREMNKVVLPKKYTIAPSLGFIRDGCNALWESSTPETENPKEGFLSIGKFMERSGDTNPDVVNLEPGSIIQIEKI